MRFDHTLLALLMFAGTAFAQQKDTGSKTPPLGPPWLTSFSKAREQALASCKPIFVYSTKTY